MQFEDKEFEEGRKNARNFGGSVYVGGVVAATMLFITFVLTAFPQNAYFSRVVMTGAGLAVGCSMLAFPYALDHWIVEKKHRAVAIWLYYVEMLFIAVNTIVSFVSLLAKVTGYAAPEWAVLYEPFSVVSIIYVIFAWGTIMHTDPQAKTKQQKREYRETFDFEKSRLMVEYLKSNEGKMDIAAAAQREIIAHSLANEPQSFFGGPQSNVNQPIKYEFQLPRVKDEPILASVPLHHPSPAFTGAQFPGSVSVVAAKPSALGSPISSPKTTRIANAGLEIKSCSYCGRQQEATLQQFGDLGWLWKYTEEHGTITLCDACNSADSPQLKSYLAA